MINARLDQSVSCAYDDRSLSDVLADVTLRLRIRLVVDEADIQAAKLERGLNGEVMIDTTELYRRL